MYGGVSIERQEEQLRSGTEFIVGTTGRIKDHILRGNTDFSNIEAIVLDEADRMLDMGFQEDVESIMSEVTSKCTNKPQFILFSATIPPWVRKVAQGYLDKDYKTIDLVKDLKNKTAKSVEHLAIQCYDEHKVNALADILAIHATPNSKVIIFTETKIEAADIVNSPKFKTSGGVFANSSLE